jgi:hypothetical protein
MLFIRYMMEDTGVDQYETASNLADFSASFSVLLNDNVSCNGLNFESSLMPFPLVGSC